MKCSLRFLAVAWVAFSCSALAHDQGRSDDGYTIESLNSPDPIFTALDSIAVRVTAKSSSAARKAAVRLNGHDVTSALSETEPGVLTGTVAGLQPGINSFEVFKNRGERHAVAGLSLIHI